MPPTLPATIFRRRTSGFTLPEILIVITIIGFIAVNFLPRLADNKTKIKSAVRHLAVSIRDAQNGAKLFNMTSRVVLDFDKKEGNKFWIETGQPGAALLTEEQEAEERNKSTLEKEEDEGRNRVTFSPDSRLMKKPFELPKGIVFERVEFAGRKTPVTGGKAYVHFFPQGLSQEAAIHLGDEKTLKWTIYISAIGGRVSVFDGDKSLAEINPQ